jgi:hypothetical protein
MSLNFTRRYVKRAPSPSEIYAIATTEELIKRESDNRLEQLQKQIGNLEKQIEQLTLAHNEARVQIQTLLDYCLPGQNGKSKWDKIRLQGRRRSIS